MIPLTHVPPGVVSPVVDWLLTIAAVIGIFMVPICIVIVAYWRRIQDWLVIRELRRRREKR